MSWRGGQGHWYWCHQCIRRVRVSTDAMEGNSDLLCPHCNGGFIEEAHSPTSSFGHPHDFDSGEGLVEEEEDDLWQGLGVGERRNTNTNFPGDHSITQIMESFSAAFLDREEEGPSSRRRRRRGRAGLDPGLGDFNPFMFHMQNLVALGMGVGEGGGNLEIFVDNGSERDTTTGRLPGNFGDYFIGPGLDRLIEQLAENYPNRYGAPAASKTAVEAMPTIKISETHLGPDSAQCAVCKDEFDTGAEVKQMPCKHMYHPDCIFPWLSQHNSCPVCRYEMPTDSPNYDQAQVRGQRSLGARNSDGVNSNFSFSGVPGAMGDPNHESVGPNSGSAVAGPNAPNQQQSSSTPFPNFTSRISRFGASSPGPFRAFISTIQQAQADTGSGPTNSVVTVSSRPNEGDDVQGNNVGSTRIDDDGDTVMSEARQNELN